MKIRTGFVSNSSSSSFILIGEHFFKNSPVEILSKFFPKTYEKALDRVKNNSKLKLEDELDDIMCDEPTEDGISIINDDGGIFVGVQLAHWSDDCFKGVDKSMDELLILSEKMKAKGLKPKLIGGTRGC